MLADMHFFKPSMTCQPKFYNLNTIIISFPLNEALSIAISDLQAMPLPASSFAPPIPSGIRLTYRNIHPCSNDEITINNKLQSLSNR